MIYTSKLTHRSGVVSSNFLVLNCCKFQKVDSLALVAKVWLWNTQALIGEHKCFCYKQKLPTILENKKRKLYEGCKILYEFVVAFRHLSINTKVNLLKKKEKEEEEEDIYGFCSNYHRPKLKTILNKQRVW